MWGLSRILAFVALLLPAPFARAHPHVFVDVGLTFRTDELGRMTSVEVTWTYDELFSLLLLSDRGLDPDADMVLTSGERFELLGFDLKDWPDGFDGALFLETEAGQVALGAPEPLSVDLQDGHLVTRHVRRIEPLAGTRLIVRPYDPFYYAALELTGDIGLPAHCAAEIIPPDRALAEAKVDSLGGLDNESLFEEVRVGIYFADTLEIKCSWPD